MPGGTWIVATGIFLWHAGLGMSLWMPACWQVQSILHALNTEGMI